MAGAIIKGDAERIALGEDWRIEVADEEGLVLFRFDFVSITSQPLKGECDSPRVPSAGGVGPKF